MKQCERCKLRFNDVLQYIDHKNTFKHTWTRMDPAEKDRIVAKVEANLKPYLLGHGVVEPVVVPKVASKPRIEIIIERTEQFALSDPFRLEPSWVG